MGNKKLVLAYLLCFLMVNSTTPASGDWTYDFSETTDLDDWIITNGSFEVRDNCKLVSTSDVSAMWLPSTGSTGSWFFSLNFNSADYVDGHPVVIYPTVTDNSTNDYAFPFHGFFLTFNLVLNDNIHNETSIELMSRKSLTTNPEDDPEVHHVGAKNLNYTLNGWQNLVITRNSTYYWSVYLNQTLMIDAYIDEWYQDQWIDVWTNSNYFQANMVEGIELAQFRYNSQVVELDDLMETYVEDPCVKISSTSTTKTDDILSSTTSKQTTEESEDDSADLNTSLSLSGIIAIGLLSKYSKRRSNLRSR